MERACCCSSAWAASSVELVLGSICAVSAADDLHTRPQLRLGKIFRKVTTVLGGIALLAGLAGLIANSGHALEILVVATTFLWLTATIWHVLTIGIKAVSPAIGSQPRAQPLPARLIVARPFGPAL
jgi:hypothetical protein